MAQKAKPKKAWAIISKRGAVLTDDQGEFLTYQTYRMAKSWACEDCGERIGRVLITEID